MGCIRVEKITEYLCEPLSRCLKDEVNDCLSACLFVSLSLSVCLFVCISVSVCLSVYLPVYSYLCVVSLYPFIRISVSVCLSISICASLHLCLYPSGGPSVCRCIVIVYLPVSFCLSVCRAGTEILKM